MYNFYYGSAGIPSDLYFKGCTYVYFISSNTFIIFINNSALGIPRAECILYIFLINDIIY